MPALICDTDYWAVLAETALLRLIAYIAPNAAEYLFTKGAVSQTVSFLEEKRLTVREPSPNGGRNQGLYLSETGQRVLAEHHALHGDMIAEISRLAGRLPPEAIEFLSQITDVIEENIRSIQQQQ